jgi:hypothetical protein
MSKEKVFDVTTVVKGDKIDYYSFNEKEAIIDSGVVKKDNYYTDGVEVYGDDWKQYVSKWFICRVTRDGIVIFDNMTQEDKV